jgi:hypothetical protein
MQKVSISSIKVGFRTRFDEGNIAELAEDIKVHGLLHPILIAEESANYQVSSTEVKSQIPNLSTEVLTQADPNVQSDKQSAISNLEESSFRPKSEIDYELIAGFRRLKPQNRLGGMEFR